MTQPSPTPTDAQRTLNEIGDMKLAGAARALYPRWFAFAISVYAGTVVALALSDNQLTTPVTIAGLMAILYYRWKRGVWMNELGSRCSIYMTLAFLAVSAAIITGGVMLARSYELTWAPYAIGIIIAVLYFSFMEIIYRPLRARIKAERNK